MVLGDELIKTPHYRLLDILTSFGRSVARDKRLNEFIAILKSHPMWRTSMKHSPS